MWKRIELIDQTMFSHLSESLLKVQDILIEIERQKMESLLQLAVHLQEANKK